MTQGIVPTFDPDTGASGGPTKAAASSYANIPWETVDLTDGSWTLTDPDSLIDEVTYGGGFNKVVMNALAVGSTDYAIGTTNDLRAPRGHKNLEASGVRVTTDDTFVAQFRMTKGTTVTEWNTEVVCAACVAVCLLRRLFSPSRHLAPSSADDPSFAHTLTHTRARTHAPYARIGANAHRVRTAPSRGVVRRRAREPHRAKLRPRCGSLSHLAPPSRRARGAALLRAAQVRPRRAAAASVPLPPRAAARAGGRRARGGNDGRVGDWGGRDRGGGRRR